MKQDYNVTGFPEDLTESFENGWHINQSYSREPVKQLRCKGCGATTFEIGTSDDYFTGIRCVNCKYEVCIHNG